ncbi:prohead protease/major capsid protein fusion protein [Massilia sp. GCM10020059]|uniref:Mu-like prophage major head subunit gpT family protein n=1 Tax=Massilia agrisoli TaxID=2892444 RepID=A0ABS8IU91_9BURK|nr:prohead protease/major capsid protein fusion protein [Massilia agrisoli]MCC6071456.1 Mu-like prophage major head subunit gpT family protein [Massilia agrisoli]
MTTKTTPPKAGASEAGTREMPAMNRAAELVPTTYNEAANTIDVVWTTGASVRRYDYWNDTYYDEALEVTPAAVDMSRFDAGTVQVLDGHRVHGGVAAILGIAVSATIADGEGRATLKLSTRPEMAGIVADIKAGIIRAISFGYSVKKYQITPAHQRDDGGTIPLYTAVAWQPNEISFVTVGADADAGTRQQPSNGAPCEFTTRAPAQSISNSQGNTMPTAEHQPGAAAPNAAPIEATRTAAPTAPAPAAAADAAAAATEAAARAADITEICTRHGVGQLAAGLIRGGNSVDHARAAVLEELARGTSAAGGHQNVRIEVASDEHQIRIAGIEEAMMHRIHAASALTDNGRQYRGMSLLEIGREFLESRGVQTRGMDRMRLATEMLHYRSGMHSTSDFASLFANVANKRMRAAYEENVGTYTQWARRAPNAPDFKNISVVQLSGAPDLLKTNEHGEFTYGTMKDAGASYALVTYGRMIALTRQAIINDDLRAFERMVTAFGASSSRLENRLVYSQLTANPVMGDTVALFHATHGNLGTGAGSALQMSALKSGRTAMRLQKGLQGEELNLAPNFLLVPASLEQDAYQLTSSNYVPAKQSDVNEFRAGGRTAVEPIVEPILDAISDKEWYLASNNSQIDTVEYCYLDGAEGPVIDSQNGFETDGVTWKCRLDFAAKAVDHRGLYKGAGV